MQALCRLFFKILDKRPAAGEQGRMYSTLENVILLALSDRSFAAAEAPDGALARAYAAAAAADLFMGGMFSAFAGKVRLAKAGGRAFEKSASAAARRAALPDAARELEKIAPELERVCIGELLEKSALAPARQFVFFGREILKVANARSCRKIRKSVFAAVSGREEPDFRVAALTWALFRGGLAGIALSRAHLRKFGTRVSEIAEGFAPPE